MKIFSQKAVKRSSLLRITALSLLVGLNFYPVSTKAQPKSIKTNPNNAPTLIAQATLPPPQLGLGRLTSLGRRAEETEITDFITSVGAPKNDLGAAFNLSQSTPDAQFLYYCVRPRRSGLRTADFHFSTLPNCQDKPDGGIRATNPQTRQVLDPIQIFKNPPSAGLGFRITPIFACQATIASRGERDYFTSKSPTCNDFPTSFPVSPVNIFPGRPDANLLGFSVLGTL